MGIPGGKKKLVKKSVIISNGSQLKKGVNFVVVVFFLGSSWETLSKPCK